MGPFDIHVLCTVCSRCLCIPGLIIAQNLTQAEWHAVRRTKVLGTTTGGRLQRCRWPPHEKFIHIPRWRTCSPKHNQNLEKHWYLKTQNVLDAWSKRNFSSSLQSLNVGPCKTVLNIAHPLPSNILCRCLTRNVHQITAPPAHPLPGTPWTAHHAIAHLVRPNIRIVREYERRVMAIDLLDQYILLTVLASRHQLRLDAP